MKIRIAFNTKIVNSLLKIDLPKLTLIFFLKLTLIRTKLRAKFNKKPYLMLT